MRRASRPLPFLVWITWVGIITLFPFNFERSQVRSFSEQPLSSQIDDIPLNLILFVPLGAWLQQQTRGGLLRDRFVPILAAVVGSLSSLSVECLQLFLPSRFPSVVDIVVNTVGALAGVYVHRRWATASTLFAARLRKKMSTRHVVLCMAALAVAALVGSATLQARTRLSNWDATYPLVVGNEQTGDRAWRGRVFGIEMTDAATPPDLLQRFADGRSVAIPGVRIAAFDLTDAAPYRDQTGQLPNLTWTRESPEHSANAAVTSKHSWLRTEGPATTLVRHLRDSDAFSLRIRCASNDLSQAGPARIVSNSIDARHRNLTVGQDRRDLVFRVRTPHTGDNALNPEFRIPGVFSDTEPRDILMTYDGATARVTVAKSGRVYAFELSPGSSLIAAMNAPVWLVELELCKLAYIACLFLVPGGLAYVLCGSWRNRLGWSAFWVLGISLLFEATLAKVSGRAFDLSSVATTGIVGALVFLATLVIPAGLTESVQE
jgi:glycopeptide antibiotics resistance protein